MSDLQDRPERPARRPRPAPDATIDPIDYRAAPKAESAAAPAREAVEEPATPAARVPAPAPAPAPAVPTTGARGAREETVQLASRVSPHVAAVLDAGWQKYGSKRAAIEHAILTVLGGDHPNSR